ncbi:MAG TPA: winged helix-turn-helix domain-containing protein [Steroidobacteraceae bacterium]|nr:winged helix-turn-helix domain-containing protein [Steroidobacteraceae bacterium]
MNETKLRFGEWVFDPESGDLERADTRIRLQEQPALLLRELIAQAGRVVTREHLIGLLWPKGVVDFDTGLNTAVRKLRVALGDVAETPRYIETLPRRGYRFIAQVGTEQQPPLQPPLPAPPGGLADGGPRTSAPAVPMAVLPVSPRRARVGPIALVLVAVAAACGIGWLLRGMARHDATGRAADRKSIAVLPFENLTGRPEDAYLAEGLHEEVLNALARIRDLKVISRASVASYRGVRPDMHEISSRLGVGTVLEGSVRRDGNVLRLSTQLIDARTDSHLLATNYDRDLDHLLSLQSEVARAVAEALTATLSAHERGELERVGTNNGDAYRDYLKAESLFMQSAPGDDSGVVEPARLLEEAVRLDPEFADAQALLSRVHTLAFVSTEQASDGERAKLAFERALAVDPKLVDARLARGLYELYVVRDLDQAFSDLEPVARLRPNSPAALQAMGFVLRRRGRMAESIPYFQRASDLDPLNEAYSPNAFITLLALRRYPEALELTKIFRARFPTQQDGYLAWARISAFSTQSLGPLRDLLSNKILDDDTRRSVDAQIAQGEGRIRDAIASWEARPDADPVKRAENLAFLYRAAGDGAQAEQRFRTLERDLAQKLQAANHDADEIFKQLALVQSMLGEHAAAIATIEQAHEHWPESLDPVNGPSVSFYRSVVLARAGRTDEAYAEVNRLLRVPFAAPTILWDDPEPVWLLLKDDPHFDKLIRHPPRL